VAIEKNTKPINNHKWRAPGLGMATDMAAKTPLAAIAIETAIAVLTWDRSTGSGSDRASHSSKLKTGGPG
jgi:hypothetical protein